MKVREYLVNAANRFPDYISNPRLEVEILIRHVLSIDRAEFFASLETQLSPESEAQLDALVQRRIDGEPLAYITGHREFFGLDFFVNPHVLIPRQETELLVDLTFEYAKALPGKEILIADVGTGSGAIAVSIAHNLPQAQVFAVDIDAAALSVADANRKRHNVTNRVHLVQGDLLQPFCKSFDIIVSNPPYISSDAFSRLPQDVLQEPEHALYGGTDGLDVIRKLISQASTRLKANGRLLIEISPEQCDSVSALAMDSMPNAKAWFANDLLGLPRVAVAEFQA